MSQGGQRQSGGIVKPSDNPYGGVNRVLLTNATTPDKVFGSNMPGVQPEQPAGPGSNAGTIYGNSHYVNPNLQGYSQTGQNIIDVNQLNNGITTPMDANAIAQMQRNNAVGQQPQIAQATQSSNLPPTPTGNPNQLYMQPPVLPQISDMNATPTPNLVNTGNPGQPAYHDLSTADGSLDYLNSIAPAPAKKSVTVPGKLFVVIGIGMIVLVTLVAIVGALGNTGASLGRRAQELGQAIANLQSIIEYGNDNADYISSDLAGVTAETNLVTTSHKVQLSKLIPLAVNEDGEATEAEADETTTEDLGTALAQGNLSGTYQTALQERLANVYQAANNAYEATDDEDIRNELTSTLTDIENLFNRVETAVPDAGGEPAD